MNAVHARATLRANKLLAPVESETEYANLSLLIANGPLTFMHEPYHRPLRLPRSTSINISIRCHKYVPDSDFLVAPTIPSKAELLFGCPSSSF
ncbi:hypothetical protein FOZ63_001321 [Perkinsus olseni]|uniref:Uncharacterized protein n=1 Tax=Perkinsus olseni TaxID=32597 RepID=A0A7J6P9J8_PEROL|nr:hypothetical protein FOZ62_029511 [Perkinsus olseni]KAF4741395.1 hypothetical protein FOZ63_001321 [Perkinsus olseni]